MKKLIALLLSVLLALTSMAPAYAAKPYLENQNFSIVLLKFVSTESLQSNQEQAVTRYRASVIDFFEEYTQFLKSQENIE